MLQLSVKIQRNLTDFSKNSYEILLFTFLFWRFQVRNFSDQLADIMKKQLSVVDMFNSATKKSENTKINGSSTETPSIFRKYTSRIVSSLKSRLIS